MSDNALAGAAVEEPLLLIVRGDRAILHALAHQETPAAPAEQRAFAKAQDMGTTTLRWSV